jgi:hypothetical protein
VVPDSIDWMELFKLSQDAGDSAGGVGAPRVGAPSGALRFLFHSRFRRNIPVRGSTYSRRRVAPSGFQSPCQGPGVAF